jgi:hypothetical protein
MSIAELLPLIGLIALAFGLYYSFGITKLIDTSTHYENKKNKKKKE